MCGITFDGLLLNLKNIKASFRYACIYNIRYSCYETILMYITAMVIVLSGHDESLMWLGSWFQSLGTAIEKQWSPEVFVSSLVIDISNTILSSDLRPRFGFKASVFANNLGPGHISICITKVKFGIWSVFQQKTSGDFEAMELYGQISWFW